MRNRAAVIALLLSASAALAQNAGLYSVSGIVVDHVSNRPLRNVVITLASARQVQQQMQQPSKEDGTFSFVNLPAGKYLLIAQQGQRRVFYQGYEGYSTGIATGPGLKSDGIVFAIPSTGSITGRVIDQDGDPVANGQVMLFERTVFLGKSTIVERGSENTRTSGKFAFRYLDPGTYYVAVSAHPWYAENAFQPSGQPAESSDLDTAYPITYYGDTDDPDGATPITVSEGSIADIQITPRAVPAVHIKLPGTAGNDAHQNFGTGAVTVKALGGTQMGVAANLANTPEGLELVGMAPGRYEVDVQHIVDGKPEESWRENVTASAAGEPVIEKASMAPVSGRVALPGNATQAPNVPQVMVALTCEGRQQAFAQTDSSGAFSFPNELAPGSYEVFVYNAGPGTYVSSLAATGAKVSGRTVSIEGGSPITLDIGLASGDGKLEGIAVRNGSPLPGAMVLLLPKTGDRGDLIRRDQSDSDGTFSLEQIVPGSYRLLAIDDGHGLAYRDPAVIAPYLSSALEVEIPFKSKGPVKVEVAPRQR